MGERDGKEESVTGPQKPKTECYFYYQLIQNGPTNCDHMNTYSNVLSCKGKRAKCKRVRV